MHLPRLTFVLVGRALMPAEIEVEEDGGRLYIGGQPVRRYGTYTERDLTLAVETASTEAQAMGFGPGDFAFEVLAGDRLDLIVPDRLPRSDAARRAYRDALHPQEPSHVR